MFLCTVIPNCKEALGFKYLFNMQIVVCFPALVKIQVTISALVGCLLVIYHPCYKKFNSKLGKVIVSIGLWFQRDPRESHMRFPEEIPCRFLVLTLVLKHLFVERKLEQVSSSDTRLGR